MSGKRFHGLSAMLALATLLAVGTGDAAPAVGTSRPSLRMLDAWDRPAELSRFAGKPLLLLYEDKDSAKQNVALKKQLSELAKGDRYKTRIGLVAIADVSSYDYWPVRGFVKDAIQDETNKQGVIIYCDWDGRLRRGLHVQPQMSNVILYAADGRVAFARSGPLSADDRTQLVSMLRAMVEPAPG